MRTGKTIEKVEVNRKSIRVTAVSQNASKGGDDARRQAGVVTDRAAAAEGRLRR
jgi:hypothetical protein